MKSAFLAPLIDEHLPMMKTKSCLAPIGLQRIFCGDEICGGEFIAGCLRTEATYLAAECKIGIPDIPIRRFSSLYCADYTAPAPIQLASLSHPSYLEAY